MQVPDFDADDALLLDDMLERTVHRLLLLLVLVKHTCQGKVLNLEQFVCFSDLLQLFVLALTGGWPKNAAFTASQLR